MLNNIEFLAYFWFLALALVWAIYMFQETFISGGSIINYFFKNDDEYEENYNIIGTHWDGIQVWLILAIGGTFAAFPKAFGSIFTNLYIPIFLLVFAIIFRGLMVELIYKIDNKKHQNIMKLILVVASFAMLIILNTYLLTVFTGLPTNDTFFSFISIFSLMTIFGMVFIIGFALVNGYLFLGLNKGFEKLELIHSKVKVMSFFSTMFLILVLQSFNNKFQMFNSKELIIYILPILLITFAIINTISFWRKKYLLTFFSGIVVMFSFIFTGFISMMPNIVVFKSGETISILEGAAGVNTLSTLLIALFIFLPIVLLYQGYKYYRFWGKI